MTPSVSTGKLATRHPSPLFIFLNIMDSQPMFKIHSITELVYDMREAAVPIRRTVRVIQKGCGSIKSIDLQCSEAGTFVSRAAQRVTSNSKTNCLFKISVHLRPSTLGLFYLHHLITITSHSPTPRRSIASEFFKRQKTNAFLPYQEQTSVRITS